MNNKFSCEIYVQGKKKANCVIWIANDMQSNSIRFSNNSLFDNGSFNEALMPRYDGYQFYFENTMGFGDKFENTVGFGSKSINADYEAAKYLWGKFTKNL